MDKDRVVGAAHEVKGSVKEAVGKAVGDAKLSEMRTWLDHKGIQPTEFKTAPLSVGNIACDVEFRDGDQAALFRAAFVPNIEITPSIFPQI